MSIQNQVQLNFQGLHFTVDITDEAFKVSNIRIINQSELAQYIEDDLNFDDVMLRIVHKLEEKEERINVRRKSEEDGESSFR